MRNEILKNVGLLLLFLAVCMAAAYFLPLWAAVGIVIVLQLLNLALLGIITSWRDKDGKG